MNYILKIKIKTIQKQTKIKNKIGSIIKKKKTFVVLKSPHVNKKSREHFIYEYLSKNIEFSFKNIYKLINFLIILQKTAINKKNLISFKIKRL